MSTFLPDEGCKVTPLFQFAFIWNLSLSISCTLLTFCFLLVFPLLTWSIFPLGFLLIFQAFLVYSGETPLTGFRHFLSLLPTWYPHLFSWLLWFSSHIKFSCLHVGTFFYSNYCSVCVSFCGHYPVFITSASRCILTSGRKVPSLWWFFFFFNSKSFLFFYQKDFVYTYNF